MGQSPRQEDLIDVIRKLIIRVDRLERTMSIDGWHLVGSAGQPAFTNSWTNYGSGYASAAFFKDWMGVVHLRGFVSTGIVGQIMFTLPVGYRPSSTEAFASFSNGAVGRVDIDLSGQVVAYTPSSNVYVTLSGISFQTIVP